jgi:hypothetical protein
MSAEGDLAAARAILEAVAAGGKLELTEVLSAARVVQRGGNDDLSSGRLVSTALRTTLAAGLDQESATSAGVLSEFIALAHAFHSYVDVWNASLLLGSLRSLDQKERGAQAIAFVALFPDTARANPERLEALLGNEVAPHVAASILSYWLESARSLCEMTGDVDGLIGDLWATNTASIKWLQSSREFDQVFRRQWAELAVVAAEARQAEGQASAEHVSRDAAVFAAAARILGQRVEVAEDSLDQESLEAEDPQEAQTATPEALARLAQAIEDSRRRIWILGRYKKQQKLLGVAKRMGFSSPGTVFEFLDYDQLKNTSVGQKLNPAKDVGVIIGAVPHSTKGLGSYTSLLTYIPHEFGIELVDVRKNNTSAELATISTGNFRRALEALLTKLSLSMGEEGAIAD